MSVLGLLTLATGLGSTIGGIISGYGERNKIADLKKRLEGRFADIDERSNEAKNMAKSDMQQSRVMYDTTKDKDTRNFTAQNYSNMFQNYRQEMANFDKERQATQDAINQVGMSSPSEGAIWGNAAVGLASTGLDAYSAHKAGQMADASTHYNKQVADKMGLEPFKENDFFSFGKNAMNEFKPNIKQFEIPKTEIPKSFNSLGYDQERKPFDWSLNNINNGYSKYEKGKDKFMENFYRGGY